MTTRWVSAEAIRGRQDIPARWGAYNATAAPLQLMWIAARSSLRDVFDNVTIRDLAEGSLPEPVRTRAAPPRRISGTPTEQPPCGRLPGCEAAT